MLESPYSLNARLLKSIYFPHCSILEAELGGHPSQIWRAIIEGRDIMKQGIIKRIGNGQSTRIWEDNWLPRSEMLKPYGCLIQNPPELVSELIDPTTATWNKHLVEQIFLPMDAKVILSIPL